MTLISQFCCPAGVTSHPVKESRNGSTLRFPMCCVPLSAVLEMKSVEKHEVLRALGLLVDHNPGDTKPVIFVSHQWISVDHPDPDAEQFTILQGAIRLLLTGHEVRSDRIQSFTEMKDEVDDSWPTFLQNALVWYDYFCVPQEESNKGDAQLAIASIPAYVEMSTITFILVPAIDHRQHIDSNGEASICDYNSWSQRGWCRMELLSAYLKVNARSPLVIRSESFMYFVSAGFLAPVTRVAEGKFTCCRLNHQRICPDGKVLPLLCDKRALFGVVRELITHRLQYERRNNNLRIVRQIKSYSHIWLRGLREGEDIYNAHENTLDAFLTHYKFATSCVVDGGWTPLRFASLSGNVNVATQLIEQNADVEASLKSNGCRNFPLEKGTTILLHLIFLCCCPEHEAILDLLVAHKANLRPAKQADALTAASSSPSPLKLGAHWLLNKCPDWDVNATSVVGVIGGPSRWPLFVTLCTSANVHYARLLLARNADITRRSSPLSIDSFFIACSHCPTSSPDIAEYLFRDVEPERDDGANNTTNATGPVRFDVNRRATIPYWTIVIMKLLRATYLGPWTFVDSALRCVGSTALICAAAEGKHRICKWLLDQKADASISNMHEETALSIAQRRGFTRVVDVLRGYACESG